MLIEILIAALLVLSGLFGLVGSVGLLKLPDPMTRLHAPTKATTLGIGGALIASMVYFLAFTNSVSFHELLITLFLFITAPITANFIAKAHLHRAEDPANLPPTGTPGGWATFDETADPSRRLKGEE
ncbi:Na+/H+ antiporter subunit G [Tabrizicola sp.]|uniref:Na+/H+ antiporter subunit G n=1 Tax=Tabrizicola sp. TaxID=2005166 RepID=UPI003D2E4CBF